MERTTVSIALALAVSIVVTIPLHETATEETTTEPGMIPPAIELPVPDHASISDAEIRNYQEPIAALARAEGRVTQVVLEVITPNR
jgi:hypothetical protein